MSPDTIFSINSVSLHPPIFATVSFHSHPCVSFFPRQSSPLKPANLRFTLLSVPPFALHSSSLLAPPPPSPSKVRAACWWTTPLGDLDEQRCYPARKRRGEASTMETCSSTAFSRLGFEANNSIFTVKCKVCVCVYQSPNSVFYIEVK